MTAKLELRNVRKAFDEKVVLRDVDLAVDLHDVVCLIGSSGSGKSTMLKAINLLVPIDEEATVMILVADRYMKEQPFFSDLFFNNKLPFNAMCRFTFRGHQTGSDDVQELTGSFMVTFVGIVVDQL